MLQRLRRYTPTGVQRKALNCAIGCGQTSKLNNVLVTGGTYLVISGSGFMMPTEAAACCLLPRVDVVCMRLVDH